MKIFYSEYITNYQTYTFGFAVYCILENLNEISAVYERGFLPYSGMTDLQKNVFYLARGVRIKLNDFELRKDDNYIVRKIEENLNITMLVKEKEEALKIYPNIKNDFFAFAERRFGRGIMDYKRLDYILDKEFFKKIIIFMQDEKPVAYLLTVPIKNSIHIWYSIINDSPSINNNKNLGKYLLIKTLSYLKSNGFQYCYVGTCYGRNSRYKTDFLGVEFYNGNFWSDDLKLLSKLRKEDEEITRKKDIFKSGYLNIDNVI